MQDEAAITTGPYSKMAFQDTGFRSRGSELQFFGLAEDEAKGVGDAFEARLSLEPASAGGAFPIRWPEATS